MADDINVTEKIMQLVEQQSKMSTQVDSLTKAVEAMDAKLDKMDKLIKNDAVQDTKLVSLESDITAAHTKIRKLEDRVQSIEQSGAQKAKQLVMTIGKYVGVAIIGAVIANAKDIIKLIIK